MSPKAAETRDNFPLPASLEVLSHPCWESTSPLLGGEIERRAFGGYYQYSCTAATHRPRSLLKRAISFSRARPPESGTDPCSPHSGMPGRPLGASTVLVQERTAWFFSNVGAVTWSWGLWDGVSDCPMCDNASTRTGGFRQLQKFKFCHFTGLRTSQNLCLPQINAVPEPTRYSKLCVNFETSSLHFFSHLRLGSLFFFF